jgi:hypothetical protein
VASEISPQAPVPGTNKEEQPEMHTGSAFLGSAEDELLSLACLHGWTAGDLYRGIQSRSKSIVRFLCLLLSLIASYVLFEVSLLVEVRLRGSLSARSAIPNPTPGAPAVFSASSCYSFYNNKTTKQ